MENDLEVLATIRECNKILKQESVDTQMKKEMYVIYKKIQDGFTREPCRNCIYYDMIEKKCINNSSIIVKMHKCWKAYGISLLKKAGFYGQKRVTKNGVN